MNPGPASGVDRDRAGPDLSRVRDLLEGLDAIVWEADAATWQFTFVSRRAEDILGYPVADWLADPAFWPGIIHPEDRDGAVSICRVATEEGRDHDFEYRALAADGRVVWLRDIVRVVKDDQGRARRLRGVIVDISEQKRAEEELRRAECRYRALFQEAPAMYAITRAEGDVPIVADCNDMFLRTLGYTREEVLERPLTDFYTAQSKARLLEGGFQRALEGCLVEEERELVAMDGRRIRTLLRAVPEIGPEGRVTGTRAMYTNLTALTEAEERYRGIFENAVEGIFQTDLEGRYLAANPALARMLGYDSPEELIADVTDVTRLYVEPGGREGFMRQVEEHGALVEFQYQVYRRDGTPIWVSEKVRGVRDQAGRLVGFEGTTLDVTERKLAEAQLQEAKAKYQALLEQIPGVTYVAGFGPEAPWTYVSPQIETLLGYTAEEWMADPGLWYRCLEPEDRERVLEQEQEEIASGPGELPSEYRMRTRDGRQVWVRDQAYVIRDEAGRPLHYQGVLFDITELKLAEEVLRQGFEREREAADRLRSLDELKNTFLSAVSHELRTPLTSILGFAATLQGPAADLPPEERAGLVERLIVNAKKLDRLLADLLDVDRLARGAAQPRRGLVDVAHLIIQVVEGTDVPGHPVHLDVETVLAEVDGPKVERIVENLLLNAAKHTPRGTAIHVVARSEAGGVLIAVEDEGEGVPEAHRERLFRPFERGGEGTDHASGTGIGLSLVDGFARLHGGRAWVQDRPGGGSSFRVFLPSIGELEAKASELAPST